jgi:thiamine-monophosphate kinase
VAGEADIIQGFLAPLAAGFDGAFGLKDDAAVITPPVGCDLVITVDAIAAGVHFFPEDDAADIGWKALAVNVSDLIGKGATPHAYVMSLAFPDMPDSAWLLGFATGLAEAQRAFGISLAGGDTDRRPGPVCITITAIGFVPAGRMVKRTTAKVADHVFVSGTLGDSALGLMLRWETAAGVPFTVSANHRSDLIGRYLRPNPPLALVPLLRDFASASMDISDGLLKDLTRMADASGVGAVIKAQAIPLSDAAGAVVALKPSELVTIATGGDDYQVLMTVAPQNVAAFTEAAEAAGVAVTEIGRIIEGRGVNISGADGNAYSFNRAGYDHF